ncbi:hypothetical protein ACYZT4_10550 [Pseudomonas sp. GB2N2]
MQILIAAMALAMSISASRVMASDDLKVEVLSRALAYRECVETYARAHAGPGASPTEIAEAANFRCQKQLEEFRSYYQTNAVDSFPIDESSAKTKSVTSQAKSYLQAQMTQSLKEVQDAAKGEAAAIVIEQRNR